MPRFRVTPTLLSPSNHRDNYIFRKKPDIKKWESVESINKKPNNLEKLVKMVLGIFTIIFFTIALFIWFFYEPKKVEHFLLFSLIKNLFVNITVKNLYFSIIDTKNILKILRFLCKFGLEVTQNNILKIIADPLRIFLDPSCQVWYTWAWQHLIYLNLI